MSFWGKVIIAASLVFTLLAGTITCAPISDKYIVHGQKAQAIGDCLIYAPPPPELAGGAPHDVAFTIESRQPDNGATVALVNANCDVDFQPLTQWTVGADPIDARVRIVPIGLGLSETWIEIEVRGESSAVRGLVKLQYIGLPEQEQLHFSVAHARSRTGPLPLSDSTIGQLSWSLNVPDQGSLPLDAEESNLLAPSNGWLSGVNLINGVDELGVHRQILLGCFPAEGVRCLVNLSSESASVSIRMPSQAKVLSIQQIVGEDFSDSLTATITGQQLKLAATGRLARSKTESVWLIRVQHPDGSKVSLAVAVSALGV